MLQVGMSSPGFKPPLAIVGQQWELLYTLDDLGSGGAGVQLALHIHNDRCLLHSLLHTWMPRGTVDFTRVSSLCEMYTRQFQHMTQQNLWVQYRKQFTDESQLISSPKHTEIGSSQGWFHSRVRLLTQPRAKLSFICFANRVLLKILQLICEKIWRLGYTVLTYINVSNIYSDLEMFILTVNRLKKLWPINIISWKRMFLFYNK